jgi:uncharacterized protein
MMKKLSWPYFGDNDMGAMSPDGNSDTDISEINEDKDFATPGYATMVDHRSLGPDLEVSEPFGGGMFFPLNEDGDDTIAIDGDDGLDVFSGLFNRLLKLGSNILVAGDYQASGLAALADKNHNIVCLADSRPSTPNLSDFHTEFASPMFYRSRFRLDGFVSSSALKDAESAEIALKNIYSQMRPLSYGLIISEGNFDLQSVIKRCNFEIIKKSPNKVSKFLIKKNDLNKVAVVKHYGLNKGEFSTFECDVAETQLEKTVGLQAYSDLNQKCGLIFKYNKPTDVMFHMGSVAFPIDVAFLNDDDTIVKICKNIKPGTLEVFGAAQTKTVLELAAGSIDAICAKTGDKLFISYGEQILNRFEKESKILENIGLEKCIYKKTIAKVSAFYNLHNFNLYSKGTQASSSSLIKQAKNYSIDKTAVVGYSLDSIFKTEDILRANKRTMEFSNNKVARSLFGETVCLTDDFIKFSCSDLLKESFYKNINKNYAIDIDSYIRVVATDSKRNLYLKKIFKDSNNPLNKVALLYRGTLNVRLANELLNAEIRAITGSANFSLDADFIRIPEEFNDLNYIGALKDRYPGYTVSMIVESLSKSAGIPVPDYIKESGRKAIRYFDRAKKSCSELSDNLNKNVSVYQKLTESPDVIKSSKGEYNESCKRNSKLTKGCLLNIKEGIKILGSIQDVSTTEEVVSSVANSAKAFSDSIKSVFDLINIIDSDDFVDSLNTATETAIASVDDLEVILDRTREYITKNILGIIILSN